MSLLLFLLACSQPAAPPAPTPAPVPVVAPPTEPPPRLLATPLPSLEGHSAHYVRFGDDGARLASVSRVEGPATRVWNVETGEQLHGLEVYPSGFDFDPDGTRMVLGLKRVAEVWDVERNRKVRTLPGHWDWVEQALYSRDGERVATYDDSPALRVFDVATGKLVAEPPIEEGLVRSMVLSSNWLFWCNTRDAGGLNRWHLETGEHSTLPIPFEAGELDLSTHGTWLAATLTGGDLPGKNAGGTKVRVWNTQTWEHVDIEGSAHQIAISDDGRWLAVSWEKRVTITDVRGEVQPTVVPVPNGVADLDLGSDNVLAVADRTPEIRLWRLSVE